MFASAPVGTHLAQLALYFAIFSLGLSSFPLYLATVPSESVPFTLAATAVALPQGLGEAVGTTFFPAIGGRIADVYGLNYTIYLVVAACAICILISLFVKETAPRVASAKQSEKIAV